MTSLSQNDLPADHYRITVTSTANPTYADLCKSYDHVSDAWDESKYKLELDESLRDIAPSTGDKVAFIKKFDQLTTPAAVAISWAKVNGYRLSFPSEREALLRSYPHLLQKSWIVDLGSFITYGRGSRFVAGIGVYFGQRKLRDVWSESEYGFVYPFLFILE